MYNKKNYVPVWYWASAEIQTPDGFVRYVNKVGFSEDGESDASNRRISFNNALKATIKVWGAYTEDEIESSIKNISFYPFTNQNAKDIENKLKAQLKKISDGKSAKDISPFGINGKANVSTETYQLNKKYHDQINKTLLSLKDLDQNKFLPLKNNLGAFYNAILQKDTHPEALKDLENEIHSKMNKSNDEEISKSFSNDLDKIFSDQMPIDDQEDFNDKITKSFSIFDYFLNIEKPIISQENDGIFYLSYLVDNKPRKHRISVKHGTIRLQASELGHLSIENIKKLYDNNRFIFTSIDIENAFKKALQEPKTYVEKYNQN